MTRGATVRKVKEPPKSKLYERARRWKDGDVLFAESVWVRLAFIVSDDPEKIGTKGWHGDPPFCVEYIDAKAAEPWNEPEKTP